MIHKIRHLTRRTATPSMKATAPPVTPSDRAKLLNLGCGRHFHPNWYNVDLDSHTDQVIRHNLLQGIPFPDGQFDAVYHSHLLEHFSPTEGRRLLMECHRVLKPGGWLRIVVPDLEQITRLYLAALEKALEGNREAAADYYWMKLELLDQMVRCSSGGMMGRYMADPSIQNIEFVRSRIGEEMNYCHSHHAPQSRKLAPLGPIRNWIRRTENRRIRLASRIVGWLLGKQKQAAFEEGLFRHQGEVHRWMYDRFSLQQVCQECGFENPQVCTAFSSQIDRFNEYRLDAIDGRIRKPDSLYMEFRKPHQQPVAPFSPSRP